MALRGYLGALVSLTHIAALAPKLHGTTEGIFVRVKESVRLVSTASASAAMVAVAAMACSNEPETATNACSPLADPSLHIVDEGVTEDRHYVVSIGAGDSPSRIFYGTPDHMTEGRNTSIDVGGCYRSYNFVLDGASYGATFAGGCNASIPSLRSKLSGDDLGVGGVPLTPLLGPAGFPTDAGAPAMGLTFFCF